MLFSCRWFVAALVAGVVVSAAPGATLITLTNATASSTYANRDARYAVNGAGLVGGLHTNTADYVSWMSVTQPTTVSGQWFRVDLGQVTPLSHFKLWNFNFWHASVQTTNRGIREAEVYLSSFATTPGSDFSNASQWTRVIDKVTFAKAPGSSAYAGEPNVSLAGLEGRWLALRVLTNFSATDFTAAISELQVFAAERPAVISSLPVDVSPTQAVLPGSLTYNGGFASTLFAYWGATDGGTVSSAWDHVVSLGVQPLGPFNATVSVVPDTEYHFRFQAVSVSGAGWSDAGGFLTTPVTVELPATVSEGSGSVPVTFRRPAAMTNTAITVNFGVSGEVVQGADYLLPTATVIMPVGAATAQTTIPLVDDIILEAKKTLVVGLGPGSYCRTAASTNSTDIVDDDGSLNPLDWPYRMTVTLSGYGGTSVLTNFPVALRLHEGLSGFRYADFASPSDGGDLRVTDAATGNTLLYEIESWNPAGTSLVWVSASTLMGNSTALKLHWGNAHAVLPGYAQNGLTWDSGFGGVWHLRQTNAVDSTVNHNNGMPFSSVAAVPGVLGNSLAFNGSNYVQVADSASLGTNVVGRLTVSTWFNSNVTLSRTNDNNRLLEKGDCYFFIPGYASSGGIVFLVKQNNTGIYSVGNYADIASNEWHHACATYDGAFLRLYIDGTQRGSTPMTGSIDDDKLPLRIGSDDNGSFFKGAMDETRIESVTRTADWVKACYDSQRATSTFSTFGPVLRITRGSLISVF